MNRKTIDEIKNTKPRSVSIDYVDETGFDREAFELRVDALAHHLEDAADREWTAGIGMAGRNGNVWPLIITVYPSDVLPQETAVMWSYLDNVVEKLGEQLC